MKVDVKIGDKFYYYDRDIWHVLSIVTDKGKNLLVIKSWSKSKFRWAYNVVDQDSLEYWLKTTEQLAEKNGNTVIKAKKPRKYDEQN